MSSANREWGEWLSPVPYLVPVRAGIMRTASEVAFRDSVTRATYVVPAGWATDGASIPWWIISLTGGIIDRWDPRTLRSAIVHDWMYSTHELTWRESNALFYRSLRAEDWPDELARLYRRAVDSVFGWWSYYMRPVLPENRE